MNVEYKSKVLKNVNEIIFFVNALKEKIENTDASLIDFELNAFSKRLNYLFACDEISEFSFRIISKFCKINKKEQIQPTINIKKTVSVDSCLGPTTSSRAILRGC